MTVAEALPENAVIAYTSYLDTRAYARSWMFRKPARNGLEHIVFLGEIDLSSIGLGEPLTRGRADLICEPTLVPRRYRVESETSIIEATFDDKIILHLASGPALTLTDPIPDAIASGHIGQLALALRVYGAHLSDTCHLRLFSAEAATSFQYSLSRLETSNRQKGQFRSSFLEEITFDDDGWIANLVQTKDGVVNVREALRLPDWVNGPLLRKEPYLRYAPDPAHTFRLVDVEIPGPAVSIGATLTIPAGKGPHPLVMFIGGSGAHDRHGISGHVDLGSHQIVDALSEAGWMGIRFDTRGAGTTGIGSDVLDAGLETRIDDARCVLEYISTHENVDRNRIALLGHSQGGLIAAELAVRRSKIRAVVLLATPGRPAEQILIDQILNRAKWLALSEQQVQLQLDEFRRFVSFVRSVEEWDEARIPERFWFVRHARRWYADHLARDPAELVESLKCPVLICQGSKDFQVSVNDARRLAAAAKRSGVPHRMCIFDNLDHLFKRSEGKANIADYYRQRSVSSNLLSTIKIFLTKYCS